MEDDFKKDAGIKVDNASGEVTITLKHAVRIGGDVIEAIKLRRPVGRDLEQLDKQAGTWGILLHLIDTLSDSDVGGLSRSMDVQDINRVALVVTDFFGGSLQTGGTF